MAGKRIGYTAGFSYSDDVLSVAGASYQSTITDPQNIKKLLAGRIDVFIGDERSALRAIAEQQADDLVHYERTQPLSEHPVFFAFQRTPHGSELHQRFNQALARMAADGRLAAILNQTR
jgi:ABC-type amino acid transport substrate-binding protein